MDGSLSNKVGLNTDSDFAADTCYIDKEELDGTASLQIEFLFKYNINSDFR